MDTLHEIHTWRDGTLFQTRLEDWHDFRSAEDQITTRYLISQMIMYTGEHFRHEQQPADRCPTWHAVSDAHARLLAVHPLADDSSTV